MLKAKRHRQKRIPKQYLKPRPMASPARHQHPFWDLVPLEAVAAIVLVAVAIVGPLRGFDGWLDGKLLRLTASREPPESVIALSVGSDLVRSGACPTTLRRVLSDGQARAALLLPAVDELCPVSPLAGGPPRVVLPAAALRKSTDGALLGFEPGSLDGVAYEALQGERGAWVAARPWAVVPAAALEDLAAGRVDADIIHGRLVVVGAAPQLRSDWVDRGPAANRVAGALAAAIEDRPRHPMNRWVAGALALAMGLLVVVAFRLRRRRMVSLLGFIGAGTLLAGAVIAGVLGHGGLVPLGSELLGLLLFSAILRAPVLLAGRRGHQEALHLLDRVEGMGSEDIYTLSDEVFWARLAKRVADSHPADSVLLAELPPYGWRLVVHPNETLTEAVIRERRRDIRRTPYTDAESGQRRLKIVPNFLIMKDTPTVFLPLETSGEMEGYVFLIGEAAADTFRERPTQATRLAENLAGLIRRRRLERVRADQWRRPGGVLVQDPGQRALRMVEGSRAAVGKLEQLGQVALTAPVGLLYADAFGDVRFLGKPVADWLQQLGLEVPTATEGQLLQPGAFPLSKILAAVAREAGEATPTPDDLSETERAFHLPAPDGDGSDRSLEFKIRRLATRDIPYFVASLVETTRPVVDQRSNVERLPERGDPLTVFSLARMLVDVVEIAKRRSEGTIRLQTPRVMAPVVGHRRELSEALALFLVEAADRSGSGGPTLTIEELPHRIELTFLDVKLGVPAAAVKRTLMAPSMPPPGLGALGALARAIENSHGTVDLKHEEGWGTQIAASFVRARPRVEPEAVAQILNIPKAPKIPQL